MNRFESVTGGTTRHSTWLPAGELLAGHPNDGNLVAGYKLLMWFMALLLVAFVAGCGNGGGSPILGGVGVVPTMTAKAITAYSLAGVAGTINEPAKTISVELPSGTNVTALVATFTTTGTGVKVGTTVQTSGATANNFTSPVAYIVTAGDATTATYTVTVTTALASAKAITAYSFVGYPGFAGTINELAKTIAVNLPSGTNVTALVATFTTTGTGVKVGTAVQTSGATANNFTSPVAYTVTAGDATTATYTVTVTAASVSAKAITAYSFVGYPGFAGTINEPAKTIAVELPSGTSKTALTAIFTTTGTGVKVGTTVQTSGATANNFTSPVAYIVTAADSTTATYTVTVTTAPATAKAITAYSFVAYPGFAGTINEPAKTIAVNLPFGANVTALIAKLTTTGTGVKVGTVAQTSGATANNFTNPVSYVVTAADTSTVTYIVTVTFAAAPPAVNLGLAATYGMATTAGVTNTTTLPITHIEGDVVLSGSSITCNAVTAPGGVGQPGFGLCGSNGSTPTINGRVTTPTNPDATTATAVVNDLKAAFLSITPPAGPPAAGSLGGATNLPAGTTLGNVTGSAMVQGDNYFVAGVYQSITSILITGDLTLDAQGDPNASFIFQSSSTIGTADGAAPPAPGHTRILLINGAKASNVWWQAATSVTLGLYSEFQGNILSAASITMKTGATSCGRLLAGAFTAGAFVFDSNVVSVPGKPFAPPPSYSQICQ